MLRLDLPTESFWVDCPYGVRLLCKPLNTAINQAAVMRAGRRVAAQPEAILNDPDQVAGLRFSEAIVALAELLVEAWEGVGSADGSEAAPLSPEGLRGLLSVPEIAAAFNQGISAPLARLTAEGNA